MDFKNHEENSANHIYAIMDKKYINDPCFEQDGILEFIESTPLADGDRCVAKFEKRFTMDQGTGHASNCMLKYEEDMNIFFLMTIDSTMHIINTFMEMNKLLSNLPSSMGNNSNDDDDDITQTFRNLF